MAIVMRDPFRTRLGGVLNSVPDFAAGDWVRIREGEGWCLEGEILRVRALAPGEYVDEYQVPIEPDSRVSRPFFTRAALEPWVPRIGERVCWQGCLGGVSAPDVFLVTKVAQNGEARLVLGGRLKLGYSLKNCHPVFSLSEVLLAPAPAPAPVTASAENAKLASVFAASLAKTRCLVCGGPAYHGLLESVCLSQTCTPIREVLPEVHECETSHAGGRQIVCLGRSGGPSVRCEPAFFIWTTAPNCGLSPIRVPEQGIVGATREAALDAWRKWDRR